MCYTNAQTAVPLAAVGALQRVDVPEPEPRGAGARAGAGAGAAAAAAGVSEGSVIRAGLCASDTRYCGMMRIMTK